MEILAITNQLPTLLLNKSDDDISDRLNYRYTVALLIFFSVVVLTRQFTAGGNIVCWVPAHFTGFFTEYVSKICWVSNTYYNEPTKDILKDDIEKKENEIKYYQWVAFILLFQAFLFYLPRIFWRTLSTRSGMDMSNLVESANNYKTRCDELKKSSDMEYIIKNIDQYVDDHRRYDENRKLNKIKKVLLLTTPCAGRFLGNYIVILYLITKIIYILNNILQMWVLSGMLGRSFWRFGVEFVATLFRGEGWAVETKYFPKIAMCDFQVYEVGNLNKSHKYTVQCVLPVNLFNQQIFTLIWFWYVIILCWNIFGLFRWIIKSLPQNTARFIRRRVRLFNPQIYSKSYKLTHFIEKYLEPDGIFMIQIIGNNTNDFVCMDLVKELWKLHYKKYQSKFVLNEPQNAGGSELFPNFADDIENESNNSNQETVDVYFK